MLQFANKLYNEKLIDEEMFTASLVDLLAKGSRNMIGAFVLAGNQHVGPEHQDDFGGLVYALKGPHGDQNWNANPSALTTGSFVITNENKYPIETVKWVDYFYTEEGSALYFLGKEGVTHIKNPDGLDYGQATNKYTPGSVGDNPIVLLKNVFKGAEAQPIPLNAAEKMQKYSLKEVWTQFDLTIEENERVRELSSDINSYVAKTTADFLTGRTPFTEWDNNIATLKKMGLDEFLQIQQTAYERYVKNQNDHLALF